MNQKLIILQLTDPPFPHRKHAAINPEYITSIEPGNRENEYRVSVRENGGIYVQWEGDIQSLINHLLGENN